MMLIQRHAVLCLFGLSLCALSAWSVSANEPSPDQPNASQQPPRAEVKPSPLLLRILDSPATDEATRRSLKLFHGQWEGFEPQSPQESAELAWGKFQLADPTFTDPQVSPLLRAEAALFRGEAELTLELLADDPTAQAQFLRAQAYEQLGRLADAVETLTPLRDRFQFQTVNDATELTAGARAIVLLAHLEGRPSQDYRLALDMLAKAHQEIDPLYWPAYIAEAELLMTKDNREEAGAALEQALGLNPRAGLAWYWLGRLYASGYNFDAAADASQRLREINPVHPLADEVDVRSYLRQRDVKSARATLVPALEALPQRREFLALSAATAAMAYDDAALAKALARFDEFAPGSPLALFTAGEYLSKDRQYVPAEALLRQAIDRSPNWPEPRLELGLMMMQVGDLEAARLELARAARLDPFHLRVNNQLRLVENLLGIYKTIETEHFIIRFAPGIDEALARDMPGPLEAMYEEITAVFQHQPARKTQIDIMPDKSKFGVRVTGMPHFWSIAAATGDVIAMTPPRSGPDQADPFNWVNVLRHEYVHTVTLAQTHNRVPHWFTEAAAVSAETTGRTYDTCQLLAEALQHDKLFDYDKINWGFVRPKTDYERPLAYAQSDWMLEFIATRWSHNAIVQLLELYREGTSDTDALLIITGLTPNAFMKDFRAWATVQVDAWGLGEVPTSDATMAVLNGDRSDIKPGDLIALLESEGTEHPELLRLIAESSLESISPDETRYWLKRYAAARPIDPWPHKQLVSLAFELGDPEDAIGSLQLLERGDNYSSVWSRQLAELHRQAGRFDDAERSILRALECEPYNASYRELAATIALQRGDFAAAAFQVESLEILEPDRDTHPTRLAVIFHRLGKNDEAKAAAQRARSLNPNANVGAILGE